MKPLSITSPPRRILIIQPGSIGDVVHAMPLVKLVRTRWPEAHISWLVTPSCAGLLQDHPMINRIILLEPKRWVRGWRSFSGASESFSFSRELREADFDLVIDPQGLYRSAWLCRQTKAPRRIGFADARRMAWMFYTHRVPVETMEQHAVDRNLKIAAALGCATDGPIEFPLACEDADRQYINSLLPGDRSYAVLLPGANWETKRWPIQKFASLVDPLRRRFGLESVIAGGDDVADLSPYLPDNTNLAGKTTLRQLTALLDGAAVVIANDSGPMHIATALNRPLVAMFGSSNPIRTGPYRRLDSVVRVDIPCSPCYSHKCAHTSCLHWLRQELVLDVVEQQLARSRQTPMPRMTLSIS